MRIPLEALMQYAIKRPPDENRRTEPTEAAPDLNDTLEDNTGQWLPPKDPAQLTQPTTAFTLPKTPSERRGDIDLPVLPFEDRRKNGDRRQRNIPVLLDTRMNSNRRDSDRRGGIRLAV